MLVDQGDVVVFAQVRRQRGEAEWRKERVLDRPEERAGGFGQRWQDEQGFHSLLDLALETPAVRDSHNHDRQAAPSTTVELDKEQALPLTEKQPALDNVERD